VKEWEFCNKMPSVAVVIPAYNAEATLEKTLNSVLTQTMDDFELVITDDGSKDATYEIATAFARRDTRLTVISQPNSGHADARNTGIRHSRAPLVAALDSDDIWHPTFLEKLSAALQEGGRETVLAYANSRIVDMEDQVIWNAPSFHQSGWVFNQLLLQNFIGNGSAMMFRRDVATRLGLYERQLQYRYGAVGCEDWLLALRLAAYGKVAAVHEYLVGYRAVPGAMSQNTLCMRRSHLFALEMVFSELESGGSKGAQWALGIAHAKCFLHEVRSLHFAAAFKDLAAALRLDFSGTVRLLFGSERLAWLLDKLPWREEPVQSGSFLEFDTRDGQWEEGSKRAQKARQWDIEAGRIAARGPSPRVADLEV
jgi:glycosyltransferase involved in cell wall biosynthesis